MRWRALAVVLSVACDVTVICGRGPQPRPSRCCGRFSQALVIESSLGLDSARAALDPARSGAPPRFGSTGANLVGGLGEATNVHL